MSEMREQPVLWVARAAWATVLRLRWLSNVGDAFRLRRFVLRVFLPTDKSGVGPCQNLVFVQRCPPRGRVPTGPGILEKSWNLK